MFGNHFFAPLVFFYHTTKNGIHIIVNCHTVIHALCPIYG